MQIKIKIKYELCTKELLTDTEMKLSDLKLMIQEMLNVEESNQILTFKDRMLVDDKKSLSQLGFINESVVNVKTKKKKAVEIVQPANSANNQSIFLKNPFMKGFMKNSEGIKSMVSIFPGLESEIDKSEELRQIVNNPSFMDEMNKLATEPEYFNQQAKNVDVFMARLETLPGGLNTISSMVKDLNDPISNIMNKNLHNPQIKAGNKVDDIVREALPNPKVNVNWLVVYRKQINELKRFGFTDIQKNLIALKQCKGNINETILFLTSE